MGSISTNYGNYSEYIGEKRYITAEMLGLRAMANAKMKREEQAMKDFSTSVPILLEGKTDKADYLKNLRFKIIVEAYIDLLARIYKDKREKEFGINALPEMFRLCQEINRSKVQSALGESGARAAAVNPDLSDLVRRTQ
jgi:hypothetical protein